MTRSHTEIAYSLANNVVPKPGDVIVVWFSCGAASAVAAKKTIEKYGSYCTVRIVNNPIKEEHDDNRRFLQDCAAWLDTEIELATNRSYPDNSADSVWRKSRAMAFPHGAPCTSQLKKIPRQRWEADNKFDYLVMGFTLEEKARAEAFALTERANILPVLIDAQLTKQDCHDILIAANLRPPAIYTMGFPNANCIGCPKATSPTYWNHVRKHFPEIFESRAALSAELGVRLVRVKGKRIYLSDLDPAALGRPLKSLKSPDCGIFCEEHLENT